VISDGQSSLYGKLDPINEYIEICLFKYEIDQLKVEFEGKGDTGLK
jgi:hypothetical protein